MSRSEFEWLNLSAEQAARRLLGCELVRTIDGRDLRVRIVETEAYDQADEASHTYKGRSKRNDAMFKGPGYMYVYFTYGMHYCCNVVCGEEGVGSGVLIRAVQPLTYIEIIEKRRAVTGVRVTNGPGKTCQALAIDLHLSGHDLASPPIRLIKKQELSNEQITISKRIGISKAIHELRRFYITGNLYISKK